MHNVNILLPETGKCLEMNNEKAVNPVIEYGNMVIKGMAETSFESLKKEILFSEVSDKSFQVVTKTGVTLSFPTEETEFSNTIDCILLEKRQREEKQSKSREEAKKARLERLSIIKKSQSLAKKLITDARDNFCNTLQDNTIVFQSPNLTDFKKRGLVRSVTKFNEEKMIIYPDNTLLSFPSMLVHTGLP